VPKPKNPASQLRPGGPGAEQAGVPSNVRQGETAVASLDRSHPGKTQPDVPGADAKGSLLPGSLGQTPPVTPQKTPPSNGPPRYATTSINGALGLICQTVTADTASLYGLDTPRGMVVTGVSVGSVGYNAGIRRDDVIVKVNGSEVNDSSALSAMTMESAAGGGMAVELLRAGVHRTVQLRVNPARS